jgi:hypothetical protein
MEFIPLNIQLERRLQAKIQDFESPNKRRPIGFCNPRWNTFFLCDYKDKCFLYEIKKRDYPKPSSQKRKKTSEPCMYNPSMFKCPAYQYYEMPLLLAEKND